MLILRTPVQLRGERLTTVGGFTVSAGQTIPFVLMHGPSHLPAPDPVDGQDALWRTQAFWEQWTSTHESAGMYADPVSRTLITLKALTYAPTGGIVAAPTTSLPEKVGGSRNWDYRFCWLRDATLTLLAFMNAGYYDEARRWRDWLLRAAAGSPSQIQTMYGLAGEKRLTEWEVPWLAGYEGSKPVRIGNAASDQLQIDVFGEVMDALHQARVGELQYLAEGWDFQRALLSHLEQVWSSEDDGIWEVRGGRRHLTHSKVMAWVAFDRAVRSHDEFGLGGPVERWRELRQEIYADVLAHAWSERKQAFTQSYGSEDLDASILLMPHLGFMPATDDRFRSTVDAIRRELVVGGLVLRYRTRDDGAVDGLPFDEGVFLPCSFWLADVLAMRGDVDQARELFERLLDLRNDVGLLSEEYDPRASRMLGNFPQAFTHLAVINTAFVLREGRGLRDRDGGSASSRPSAP
jgi:GH15 family glucan-1,4-alpha-glucosidase